jgi:putative transposon-encoded protein
MKKLPKKLVAPGKPIMKKKPDKPTTPEKTMWVEVEGFEAIEKIVRSSGNSGRVYVPPNWVTCRVKIIRLDPLPVTQGLDS